jgi:hypothetical protein
MMKAYVLGEDAAFQSVVRDIVEKAFASNAARRGDVAEFSSYREGSVLNVFKTFFETDQTADKILEILNWKWPSQRFALTLYRPCLNDGTFHASFLGKSMRLQMNASKEFEQGGRGYQCKVEVKMQNDPSGCCSCSQQ